jgi:hypothetical protein
VEQEAKVRPQIERGDLTTLPTNPLLMKNSLYDSPKYNLGKGYTTHALTDCSVSYRLRSQVDAVQLSDSWSAMPAAEHGTAPKAIL